MAPYISWGGGYGKVTTASSHFHRAKETPDNVFSSDSLIDWLNSFKTTENVTSGQRGHQPWREVNQVNLQSDFRFSSELKFRLNKGNPVAENECASSIRRDNMENSQSHVANPQSESRSPRPSTSERRTPGALMKVTPTRGQKRSRSRSPSHSRTTVRTESGPLPGSLGELVQRLHHSQSSLKSGSIADQLHSFESIENVTSRQKEHQSWREVSQVNPHSDFRFKSEIKFNLNNGSLNAKSEYVPSTRLFRGETMESSRSHEEFSPFLLTGEGDPSGDASRSDSLIDWLNSLEPNENMVSGQREYQPQREVSQVNPHCDFRINSEINFDNGSASEENEYAPSARLPREESTENSQSHAEDPSSSQQSTPGVSMEVSPTRGQKRARSRSSDHSRTRARTESGPLPGSLGKLLQRLHHSQPTPTFEQCLVNETEGVFRTQHQDTLRQETTGFESQNRGLFATSGQGNAGQGESSPEATSAGESFGLRQINPITGLYSEVGVHPAAYSEKDSITSGSQITYETPNDTVTLESEQGELRHIISHYEQADTRAYASNTGIPTCRILNPGLRDITSGAMQSMLRQTMTDFSDSSSLIDNDSDLEHSLSSPSQSMARSESPNGSDSSHGSRSPGSHSSFSYYSCLHFASTPSSNSSYMSSSSSTQMSSSSSSDENSEISTLFFEGRDERLSPYLSSETSSDSISRTPIMFDESDSWPSLDQFFLLNGNNPTGLSKAQIDNLAIRSFAKNDTLKVCTICITEYTEGNKLRILPCSHEYHVHCIDRWLSDNSTCPICRRKVVGSGERKF